MGIISNIFNKSRSQGSSPTDDFWYLPMMGKVNSGVEVNERTSMNYSAVYLAVMFISQSIASLPYHLYRDMGDKGKQKAKTHYLYNVIHKAPNMYMPAMTFWETLIAHAVSWGNGYAEKIFDVSGRVAGLFPITPDRVKPAMRSGKIEYDIRVGTETITLPRERILHIPGLGFDGLTGYSVVTMARESIGLGMASEQFGARFFGQGAHPGMIVTHPGRLGPDTHSKLETSLGNKYEGLGHAHRMMLLDEGMKFEKVGLSQKDSQFLETRVFQIDEIARWFNLPPHVLKDLTHATFSNIESQALELVKYTLRPWMVRVEQHCDLQLLGGTNKVYHRFNAEGLLRGDAKARSDYYKTMWNIGGMSINDVREKEDMNPVDGGDTHFVPLNTISLEQANKIKANEENKQPGVPEREPEIEENDI